MPDPSPSPDDLRALRAAATPGPWRSRTVQGPTVETHGIVAYNEPVVIGCRPEDAQLIVAAVNSLLPLLDRAEAAEARVRELEKLIAEPCVCGVRAEDGINQECPRAEECYGNWLETKQLRGRGDE